MEEFILPARIANAIMQDTSFEGYYLIIEGENDYKVYNRLVDEDNVEIRQAHGKQNVKDVLEILSNRGFEKKFGIIDSDFDNIEPTSDELECLFKTDLHDIEVMVFSTNALEKLIQTSCKKDKIKEFETKYSMSIRNNVLKLAEYIGKLKLLNQRKGLQLRFKPKDKDGSPLKYKKFISEKDLSFLGEDKLIETILNSFDNNSKRIDKKILKQDYSEVIEEKYDSYQVVNGHDLANILCILIKKVLKSKSEALRDYECVEECLILAYDIKNIFDSDLYKKLLEWQNEKDIRILKYIQESDGALKKVSNI